MDKKQLWIEYQNWFMYDEALTHFVDEAHHFDQAKIYAKNNPEKRGFITFPMERTGGYWFYWIQNGQAESRTGMDCFAKLKGYTKA